MEKAKMRTVEMVDKEITDAFDTEVMECMRFISRIRRKTGVGDISAHEAARRIRQYLRMMLDRNVYFV